MSFWSKIRGKSLAETQDLPELTVDEANGAAGGELDDNDSVVSDSANNDLLDQNGDEVETSS